VIKRKRSLRIDKKIRKKMYVLIYY